MKPESYAHRLQRIVQATVDGRQVKGATVALAKGNDTPTLLQAGNLQSHTPYFIASTTKLYVTALILMLAEQNRLSLDDPLSRHLPPGLLQGLHVYRGREYTRGLSIRHLLCHNSGLADYLQTKGPNGRNLLMDLQAGQDRSWTCEEAVAMAKNLGARFEPGKGRKALYADTNYQLLGCIVQSVHGQPLAQVLQQQIATPLGLQHTYLYTDTADTQPHTLYYKDKPLAIPAAMVSFGADGGIVSTATECLTFVRAFFGGQLFDLQWLPRLYDWRRVMFPLEYGVGLMRFRLPWFMDPLGKVPYLLGHSGLSGAFAFYAPQADLYMTGTVNQIHRPGRSFRLMVKLAMAAAKQ